jgi:class 3 adenylate cyclase
VIPDQGRYLAEHIPGAQYLELASGGHWPWAAPDADRFLDKLQEFLTGAPQAPGRDRVLATVAFTDIVDSTAMAASMGDRRWREVLEVHDSVARREVAGARGRTVKSTGDGLLATFDGLACAIRCVVRSSMGSRRWACMFGPACTPARSSCSATTWAASPSPSPPA